MITMLLAWIEAKYKHGYELLFIGTVLIDIEIIDAVRAFIMEA